jgi:hypothetical protein
MSAAGMCTAKGDAVAGSLRGHCEVNGSPRDCRIFDLGPDRVFVESFVPAVRGSTVQLRFRLPNGHRVSTNGVVSHHEFKSGFDVEFTDMSPADREQINSLVA